MHPDYYSEYLIKQIKNDNLARNKKILGHFFFVSILDNKVT